MTTSTKKTKSISPAQRLVSILSLVAFLAVLAGLIFADGDSLGNHHISKQKTSTTASSSFYFFAPKIEEDGDDLQKDKFATSRARFHHFLPPNFIFHTSKTFTNHSISLLSSVVILS